MGIRFSISSQASKPSLGDLPEGCAAVMMKYMDPPQICKLASLNRAFRGASWSDFVWESKLPPNYEVLVRKIFNGLPSHLGKREIYERLCTVNSFDRGTKKVWLDRSMGELCLSISAKGLSITRIDDRRYWNHIPSEESSGEIASSFSVVWLQRFKHRSSCYKGAHVACLGNMRTFSSSSSSHAPNNLSRRFVNSGGLLKYTSDETYSVLQAPCLQHWFKNWQTLRKHKLTASTFASAIGFWRRRRAQLWLEKIGAIKPFSGNLATCWSNIKELEALERYKLLTRNTVLFPEFQVYNIKPEDNWLAASPDGIIDMMVYELPSRGILEIKCPYFDGNMRKAFPWTRIPIHYIPQAQGLMEILGRDWMDFYVWTLNGSTLFRLYRDAEYWDVMKIALYDFWWKHVQPARELYINNVIADPFFQLRSLTPAPRHELCRDIVDRSKHIVYNSKLLIHEIHWKRQN